MIDLTVVPEGVARAVERARERGIVVPTFAQMRDLSLPKTPSSFVCKKLRHVSTG